MDPPDEQAHETLLEGEGTSGAESLCALMDDAKFLNPTATRPNKLK